MTVTIDTRGNPPESNIGLVQWVIPSTVQKWSAEKARLISDSEILKTDQVESGSLDLIQEPLYKTLLLLVATCQLRGGRDLLALSLINSTLDNVRDNLNLIANT